MKKKENKSKSVGVENNSKYAGNATVKIMHGKKVLKTLKMHNEGHEPLFEFLMYCLSGAYYDSKSPKYLRVFDSDDIDLTENPIVKNSTPTYTEDSSSCSVVLSFIVPPSYLKEYSDIKIFKIYSEENALNKNFPSATIELDEALSISSSANLLVAWKMTVSN